MNKYRQGIKYEKDTGGAKPEVTRLTGRQRTLDYVRAGPSLRRRAAAPHTPCPLHSTRWPARRCC